MKYFLPLFFLSVQWAFAQNAIINGKVVSIDNAPVEFANVNLFQLPDSTFINALNTNEAGTFTFNNIGLGNYYITIKNFGFTSYQSSLIAVVESESNITLPSITLQSSTNKLKEVEVTAEKSYMQQMADKKVYNVDKNITTAGGTAADVLNNIASTSQDADGNISLRGSENVSILINGKPSTIAGGDKAQILQQIPANTIQSIEVITNPSSKYDAEGATGIINIITKRNEKENLSGNIGVAYTIYDMISTNILLSYKNKKYNIGGSYAINYNPRFFEGYSFRENIFADTAFNNEQTNNGTRIQFTNTAKINADYYFNANNTLSTTFSFNRDKSENPETIAFLNYNVSDVLGERRDRKVTNERVNNNYDAGINYKHLFKKKGNELSADFNFSNNRRNEFSKFEDNYATINFVPGEYGVLFTQTNTNIGNTFQYLAQIDNITLIGKTAKIETGIKSTVRNIEGNFELNNLDTLTNTFQFDSLNGKRTFEYTEQVYAAYFNYSNKIKALSYQAGIRAEQTFLDGSGQSFTTPLTNVNRKYFNVFPSAFLAYTFKNQHQLQLNYAMRISRPQFSQLMPFVEISDPFNLRIGNPLLFPEIIHSIELGWNKTFISKHNVSSTLYYRQTNNNINRIRTLNDEGVATVTFENLNKQFSYGAEIIIRNNFAKWVDVTTSFNGFQSYVNGTNVSANFTNNAFAYTFKNSVNFRFLKNTSFQTTFNYNSPIPIAQGRLISYWGFDAALKKDILKNKATIAINAQDIFFSRRFGVEQQQATFNQEFWRRRQSRVVVISFNYRFGNDIQSNKKKGTRGDGGGMPDDF